MAPDMVPGHARDHADPVRYRAAWRSARRRARWQAQELARFDTLTTELLNELEEPDRYPVLAWLVPAAELQPEYAGWARPAWRGSDIQGGRDWRTLAVRVPGRAYLILRLWPLRDGGRDV